jgi:hypothetical protein
VEVGLNVLYGISREGNGTADVGVEELFILYLSSYAHEKVFF